ncbi:MAG: HAD family phosphatase [Pseudomonadota bacterium]
MTMRIIGKLKAVIFDLDGVILDSMSGHAAAWLETFAEAGFAVDEAYIYQNEGMLDLERLSILAGDGRVFDRDFFDRLLSRQRDIYLGKFSSAVGIYPRAGRLVERLSAAGLALALVTSSSRQVLSPELRAWLDQYFDQVVTGDQVARTKPHPDPYLQALAGLGVDRTEAVVVENAPAGIEAAKAAGLTCLALTTTLPPANLGRADLVVGDHEDLRVWLEPYISG